MKPLHKLGKYRNLKKLNKIANNPYFTVKFPIRHNYVTPLYDEYDDYSYTLWGTLGVEWHVDDINEDKKYSIILVVQSDNYELYTSTINHNTLEKLLKPDYYPYSNKRVDNLLVCRKDTQRLVLKAGDILLLDISYYHKLENTKKTKDPFIFISLDIDFVPKIREAVRVVNYFVHDFLHNED